MDLCQLCELDCIRPNVRRKVCILEEYVSRQPLVWVIGVHLATGDPRHAIPSGIVLIHRCNCDVTGINSKGLFAKCERKTGIGRAWYGEGTVPGVLSPGDVFVDNLSIRCGHDQEGGASIQDRGTALQTKILSIYRYSIERPLPKAFLVDIVKRDQGVLVKFTGVQPSQRGFAIVFLIGETRKLERNYRFFNLACFGERFHGGQCFLFREGTLGQTHNAIKEGRSSRKVCGFLGGYAKSVTRKLQASNGDII